MLAARSRRQRSPRRSWPPRPSPASTRSTGSVGPRPSPPWPIGTASIRRGRRHRRARQPLRGPRRAPGRPGGRGRGAVAFAGPSEVAVVADDTTPVATSPPSTWSCRPSTGPTAWPGWSPGPRTAPQPSRKRWPASPRPSPRRDEIDRHPGAGRLRVLVDGPAQAMDVANHVAPEHLELMTADPESLVPLVRTRRRRLRRAVGPGQRRRLPGRAQPRAAHGAQRPLRQRPAGRRLLQAPPRRQPRPRRPGRAGPPRCGHGRRRGPGRPRRVGAVRDCAARSAVKRGRAGAVSRLPAPRADLGLREGYHSAQVDVEVRLNTNESPFPPPAAGCDALLAEARRDRRSTATPTGRPCALREAAGRAARGPRPTRCSAPTGPTRSSSALCLAYGGPGRGRPPSSRPTPCTATSPTSPAPRWSTAPRRRRLLPRPRRRLRRSWPASSRPSPSCARPTTRPGWPRTASTVRRGARRHARAWWSWTRPTGSSPTGRPSSLVDDDVPLVVTRTFSKTWSLAGAAPRLPDRPGAGGRHPRAGRPAVPPRRPQAGRRAAGRCGHVTTMEAAGRRCMVVRAAAPGGRAWPTCRSRRGRRRPTSSCSAQHERKGSEVWQGLVDRSVLVRDTSSWPGLDGCLRVTVGTPEENDRLPRRPGEVLRVSDGDPARAGAERRGGDQGDVDRGHARRSTARVRSRSTPGCRSSTTWSPSWASTAAGT